VGLETDREFIDRFGGEGEPGVKGGHGSLPWAKISVVFIEITQDQALVAHACNPSYSGGRDEEDHGLRPARANSLQDPIQKQNKTHTKRGW
jgi:hypothetical protein